MSDANRFSVVAPTGLKGQVESACTNCAGAQCMGCVQGHASHACEDDCPNCCGDATQLPGKVTPLGYAVHERLLDVIAPFNTPELRVILFVAQRVAMGRRQYGPLEPRRNRDWVMELAQEAADALVYASAHRQSLE